jgi:hypothetical protein
MGEYTVSNQDRLADEQLDAMLERVRGDKGEIYRNYFMGLREAKKSRRRIAELEAEVEWLRQHVCDECADETGAPTFYCENRVEGRYVCACVAESEPYQELKAQLARKDEALREIRIFVSTTKLNELALEHIDDIAHAAVEAQE